jgi:hypothetical protein
MGLSKTKVVVEIKIVLKIKLILLLSYYTICWGRLKKQ